jgi:3-oxoacyl-(acyl-carrier-protein) synthase
VTAFVSVAGSWTSPSFDPADDAVAAWAAGALAEIGAGADALLVATLDSGARESVRFWRESGETGLAFANPRAFPWTLANSPAGRIAQELGIRGPTFTLVGGAEALTAALDGALEELETGRAKRALVVALDGVGERQSRLAALVLTREKGRDALGSLARSADAGAAASLRTASETLAAALDRLAAGERTVFGAEGDNRVELRPGP